MTNYEAFTIEELIGIIHWKEEIIKALQDHINTLKQENDLRFFNNVPMERGGTEMGKVIDLRPKLRER